VLLPGDDFKAKLAASKLKAQKFTALAVAPPQPPPAPQRKHKQQLKHKQQEQAPEQHELPHSLDAERGVLSSILQDCQHGGTSVIAAVAAILQPFAFYAPQHRTIYKNFLQLWRSEAPIDLISFTQHMRDRGKLDEIGGPGAVAELIGFCPSASAIDYYVNIVLEKFKRREIIADSNKLQRAAYGVIPDDNQFMTIVQQTTRRMIEINNSNANGSEQFNIQELKAFDKNHDKDNLVGFRYIVRGGSALWCGPSGSGKSSLEMQLAIYWGSGETCFGLRPVRPLKSVIIQAENDFGDMSEQLQGVLDGIDATGDLQVNEQLIEKNVIIQRVIGKSGLAFIAQADLMLVQFQPDLLWIDPLFAYAGCDLMNAKETGWFLRDCLFPMALKRNCALNVMHHIGKPIRDKQGAASGIADIDYQYLGFGTSEIQNAFRAVNILIPVPHSHVYKLQFSKRGERAGARSTEGEGYARAVYLEHSQKGICWLQSNEPESAKKVGAVQFTPNQILEHMSIHDGKTTSQLQTLVSNEEDMSRKTFFRLWRKLREDKRIIAIDGKWIKSTIDEPF
jgi:hypothetical protein